MEFKSYIKAVGTGPKGNRELSYEESVDMMKQILLRKIPNEMISAFLLGWRLKPETIMEYRGALDALDSFSERKTIENSIELGYPFDGKASNPFLFPLIAKVLLPFKINLVIMGDDLQPAKGGVTIKDLKTNVKMSENVFYFDRSDYLKQLHDLTDIRMMLGMRTAFNTIEKLPNLGNSRSAITGVFHKPYVQKYNDIFVGRYERFALLQGNEGAPELFNKAKLWLTVENKIEEFFVNPEHYGIEAINPIEDISIQNTLDIINDPPLNIINLSKLNAAIILFVSGRCNNIGEGYELLH